MTVTCSRCGVVDVTDAGSIMHISYVLAAFAVGNAPLSGIHCQTCNKEVLNAAVRLDGPVDPWLVRTGVRA